MPSYQSTGGSQWSKDVSRGSGELGAYGGIARTDGVEWGAYLSVVKDVPTLCIPRAIYCRVEVPYARIYGGGARLVVVGWYISDGKCRRCWPSSPTCGKLF